MKPLKKGTTGAIISLDAGVDISGASGVGIDVLKPDGTIESWNGSVDPLRNTFVNYTLQSGNLDQIGIYRVEAFVSLHGGFYPGETDTFEVVDNFE